MLHRGSVAMSQSGHLEKRRRQSSAAPVSSLDTSCSYVLSQASESVTGSVRFGLKSDVGFPD